jgi:predicted 2-oxoglutarate/Fe(II)-dependent dioxygenase YbiX
VDDLSAGLGRHFDTTLTDCQGPQLLHCVTGDFYQYHRDEEATSPTSKSRRISAVIFLNGTSAEPRDGMYGGGALTRQCSALRHYGHAR